MTDGHRRVQSFIKSVQTCSAVLLWFEQSLSCQISLLHLFIQDFGCKTWVHLPSPSPCFTCRPPWWSKSCGPGLCVSNTLDQTWSKQDRKTQLPVSIRPLFMFSGKTSSLQFCAVFTGAGIFFFLLWCHRLHATSFTLSERVTLILVPNQKHFSSPVQGCVNNELNAWRHIVRVGPCGSDFFLNFQLHVDNLLSLWSLSLWSLPCGSTLHSSNQTWQSTGVYSFLYNYNFSHAISAN